MNVPFADLDLQLKRADCFFVCLVQWNRSGVLLGELPQRVVSVHEVKTLKHQFLQKHSDSRRTAETDLFKLKEAKH